MAVNYASKYSQNVDERFSTGSLTNGIVNGEFDWLEYPRLMCILFRHQQ